MKRAALVYSITDAQAQGEDRHPRVVVSLLAYQHEFSILEQTEQVSAQTFTFEVETGLSTLPAFPTWITARPHR